MEHTQEEAWEELKILAVTVHGRLRMVQRVHDPDTDPELKTLYKDLIVWAPVAQKAIEN